MGGCSLVGLVLTAGDCMARKGGAEDVIGTSAALCTLGSVTVPSLAP